MPVLRQVVGETLRAVRMRQRRTLREVSATARVSLGYLSEVERGQKEPSSELLAAIAGALDVELSELFAAVAAELRRGEKLAAGVPAGVPAGALAGGRLAAVPAGSSAGRGTGAGSARVAPAAPGRAGADVCALSTVAA